MHPCSSTDRYQISILIKSMWESSVHKMAIIKESNNGNNFIEFINMMINDTTFILDESLGALKRIHKVQVRFFCLILLLMCLMFQDTQSQELPTSRAWRLSQDEKQCR